MNKLDYFLGVNVSYVLLLSLSSLISVNQLVNVLVGIFLIGEPLTLFLMSTIEDNE